MIKQVFYNISKRKQDNIIDSAKKEIILDGFDHVKVVNICKRARIPRSAFYRYFDSLDDVFEAVLNAVRKQKRNQFARIYLVSEEDLFLALRSLLMNILNDEDSYLLIKSFVNKKIKIGPAKMDLENLNLKESTKIILKLYLGLIRNYAVEYYEFKKSKEDIFKDFNNVTNIIKNGFLNT